MNIITHIFDILSERPLVRRLLLASFTIAMVLSMLQLSYKEDITDFLPLSETEKQNMDIYKDISGANKLVVLFSADKDNPEATIEAIDMFCDIVRQTDTIHGTSDMTASFDMEKVSEVTDYVYQNIPYFLTEKDYQRMDSLLAMPDAIPSHLDSDRQMLMFPSGGLLSQNISRDPLNLFTPVVAKLQSQQQENKFEIYDGYIFTPDMTRAIVMLTSPFGNAETDKNALLMQILSNAIEKTQQKHPAIEAHILGGPQIAVGNARQIKSDTLIAVSLSVVIILLLLFIAFRSVRNILLIAISIGWGWIFALGGLALFHDSISIIVIGISSVILGIAVNYPLHLIAHTAHETNIRTALKDICTPLIVGNITTVGAFVALIPLNSVALRDLGCFAALLLLGSILYVILFLPHQISIIPPSVQSNSACGSLPTENVEDGNSSCGSLPTENVEDGNSACGSLPTGEGWGRGFLLRIAHIELDNNPWLIAIVIILTAVFGWYSLQIEFDSNLSNINYMTSQQRSDMEYFQKLTATDTTSTLRTLYVPSSATTMEAALDSCLARRIDGVSQFLVSQKEQQRRLTRWKQFCTQHHDILHAQLDREAHTKGFATEAFSDFHDIIDATYTPQSLEYFEPLTTTVFVSNISVSSDKLRYTVIDKLSVDLNALDKFKAQYPGSFDIESLNSSLANSLSDNFNYIGWACSIIVFLFLWFSFRRIELAIISFVPMAVSWVWILGIMALLGIKFNIVNIILATFIFGQGDDYTIFMTEGCLYEHRNKKPILASYKHSILLSAIIMFVGIGTLIVAKHPALHSLAEVTIVGMSSVVFMSWMIPPLLFRLLVKMRKTI